MIEYLYLGLKRTATILFKIVEKVITFMGEVDIVIRPATLPPMTQVNMLDCCVCIFILFLLKKLSMVMKEVI